jgi:hypothetical protein
MQVVKWLLHPRHSPDLELQDDRQVTSEPRQRKRRLRPGRVERHSNQPRILAHA